MNLRIYMCFHIIDNYNLKEIDECRTTEISKNGRKFPFIGKFVLARCANFASLMLAD